MAVRKIVHIDEDLCDGCGLCVPSCAEGAIQIIDGKARLVGESLCDGLGACLGDCPNDAIAIEEREAAAFDEEAVEAHLAGRDADGPAAPRPEPAPKVRIQPLHGGCPGARAIDLGPRGVGAGTPVAAGRDESALGHWPVKLKLVPPTAPFFQGADLLLAADCAPFALARFHERLLGEHAVVIGCPKFDDYHEGRAKLTAILESSGVRSLTVVTMEVPCCNGFWRMAQEAVAASGRELPLKQVVIGVRGEILAVTEPDGVARAV